MLFKIASFVYRTMFNISAALERFRLRRLDKQFYSHRKQDWEFLSAEELRHLNRKDKYAYAIFKNMAGGENLSYYVPNALYKTRLLPKLNPLNHTLSGESTETCFSDKNYAELLMDGFLFPKVVFRCIRGQFFTANLQPITGNQALELTAGYSELVFKQSQETGHGTGVSLLMSEQFEPALSSYAQDYVVQERIQQHESLAYFNESSVNILRITSLNWRGHVYVLGGLLRIGAPGAFCDHESHGDIHHLNIAINEDGTLASTSFDLDTGLIYNDIYGKEIQGSIPRYEEIKDQIIREHAKYPYYGLIGWDITLDRDENIICMEFNTKWPGIKATQYALGPIFAQVSKDGVPLLDEFQIL